MADHDGNRSPADSDTEPTTAESAQSTSVTKWIVALTIVAIVSLAALPVLHITGVVDVRGTVMSTSSTPNVADTGSAGGGSGGSSPGYAGDGREPATDSSVVDGGDAMYPDNPVIGEVNTYARDASATVSTPTPLTTARDAFVAAVVGSGGQVTSENVTTAGTPPFTPAEKDAVTMQPAPAIAVYPLPDPYYPPGSYGVPGIRLSAEIPAAAFTSVIDTVNGLGTVVEFNQSVYDTGTSAADYTTRIAGLRTSIDRLETLLDNATTVSDIVELENALAARQNELDSLLNQRDYATNQTSKARVSLMLVTPETVTDYLTPQPTPNQFTAQLKTTFLDTWPVLLTATILTLPAWFLGVVLLIVSNRNRHQRAGKANE